MKTCDIFLENRHVQAIVITQGFTQTKMRIEIHANSNRKGFLQKRIFNETYAINISIAAKAPRGD